MSAACFGAMGIFGKLAYTANVAPGALLLVRFSVAAAVLSTLLVIRPELRDDRQRRSTPTGPRRTPLRVLATAVGLGAVGYAMQACLYFAALERMDASLLSLVFYTYPLLVTLTAALLGRDRLTHGRCLALVIASSGTVLVLLGTGGADFQPQGVALAFGAAVTYTGYILIADTVVHRLPPVLLSALVMAGAALTMAARALVTGGVSFSFGLAGWFWLVCISLVSTVAAMLTFFVGLRRSGPATAAVLSTFEPVVTTALAALTLGEFLTPAQFAGGLLVLFSVVLVVKPARMRQRPPAASAAQSRTSTTLHHRTRWSPPELRNPIALRVAREPVTVTKGRPL